jgi:hypothetical protein
MEHSKSFGFCFKVVKVIRDSLSASIPLDFGKASVIAGNIAFKYDWAFL